MSACATCDGFFFRGVDVAVVGGGDTAMEEAIFLTKYATKVYVSTAAPSCARRRSCRTAPAEPEDRLPGSTSVVDEILGDGKAVTGVRLRSTKDGPRPRELPLKGVFMGIGHEPNTEDLQGPARDERRGLPHGEGALDRDERAGRLRGGRRVRPDLPPGGLRRGHGLHGGHRRRAYLGEHATETWD